MKTAHTPGPWYESKTGSHQGLIIAEETGENIAVSYKKENAALIAAAPELLAALELCLKNSEFRRASGVESGPMIEREIEVARAAIAKARGET